MKRTKILLPLTTLIIAPTLGAQVVACGPSKTKEPTVKQNIYIEPSDFPEVVVESTTEMFDPANPKIIIDVAAAYEDNYTVSGVGEIWCGPIQLAQYDEDRDYIVEKPGVDSTSMVITFLRPEKITKALYITPTVKSIARHTISLETEEGQEDDFVLVGTECKHEYSYRSEISFSANVEEPTTRKIIVYGIKVQGEDGSSRPLVDGADYSLSSYTDPETEIEKISVQFSGKVVDGDVTISCGHILRGTSDLSIYIGEKLARTERNSISEGEQTITLRNPLFDLGCDTLANQTHRVNVEAFNGQEQIDEQDIDYDPDDTKYINITFTGEEAKNLRVYVHPSCKEDLTPKECLEEDEWSKVLAMISWSNEDPDVFCRFYDTDSLIPTEMKDFLGATKYLTWNNNDYPVMVVATNYYHYALEHDDDKTHVRDDSCSEKVTLFTFKFMQALSKTNGDHIKTNWREDVGPEHGSNMNCWYCFHNDPVWVDEIHYYSSIPREILNDGQNIEGKKFTKHFSDQQFVKAVKRVGNYTRVSNVNEGLVTSHQCCYINDIFFLPTAVQLGMVNVDQAAGKSVPYSEPENMKPVFDYYKQYQRWNHNDSTSEKPQLAITNKLDQNVGYWVATAHSNSSSGLGAESISSIEVPNSSKGQGWRLGYHDIDGTMETLIPCFCL